MKRVTQTVTDGHNDNCVLKSFNIRTVIWRTLLLAEWITR